MGGGGGGALCDVEVGRRTRGHFMTLIENGAGQSASQRVM